MQPVALRNESRSNDLFSIVTALSDPSLEEEITSIIHHWNASVVISSHEDPALERESGIWVVDQALFRSMKPEVQAPVVLVLDEKEAPPVDSLHVFVVRYTHDNFKDQLERALLAADRRRLEKKVNALKESHQSMAHFLGTLRTELSRFYHDMNNPLSITSGNTQLLLEIATADTLDQDLIDALKDVEDANQQIKTYLQRILILKNDVASYLIEREDG